ncbi:MAG: Hsp20/alpha crystallin family protein [Opitutaceae bacterium]|jgi:HSP20 family molecular chaperone IbpA
MTLLNSIIPALNRQPSRSENSPSSFEVQTVKPYHEIRENTDAWGLTAHLPGVDKTDLEITVDQHQIRILGRRTWKAPEGWTALYRESSDAPFELILEHENSIDAEKIHAELKDGILHISLPKVAAIKPHKISVG